MAIGRPNRSAPEVQGDRTTPRLALDDHGLALYTIGQVADILGVQQAYLRRLDAEGIVRPARSGGGQRRYSRHEIDQVRQVAVLTDDGLALAWVQRLWRLESEVAQLGRQLAEERASAAEADRHGFPAAQPNDHARWP